MEKERFCDVDNIVEWRRTRTNQPTINSLLFGQLSAFVLTLPHIIKITSNMKQAKLLFLLITALAFASCCPTARQTVADVEQPTDSTEAVTSADTLRLVITDKHMTQTDSLIGRTLLLPLDSIVMEMMNNTDSTCVTGEAYTLEQRVNDEWSILPIKPRKDGAVYAFNDIGYELAPHSTRLFTIHVDSDKYDFERGREYRIVKELSKSRQSNPQSVYCYFTIE